MLVFDKDFNEGKVLIGLKNMKNNKFFGCDGFIIEFYNFFFRYDFNFFIMKVIK